MAVLLLCLLRCCVMYLLSLGACDRGFSLAYPTLIITSVNNTPFGCVPVRRLYLFQYTRCCFGAMQCLGKIDGGHDDTSMLINKDESFTAKLKFLRSLPLE